MEGFMHLFFILSGLCFPYSRAIQPHFVLFQTPKTWHDAQSFCREKCIDLVTINDMREMQTVLEAVKDKYEDAVWIGLSKGTTLRFHWSLQEEDFYKEGEQHYFIWSSEASYNCGSYNDGKLTTATCGQTQNAICFDGTKQGVDQYVLTTQKMSWTYAQEYCRTQYTDLVSLRNDAEYEVVREVANGRQVWVGLFTDYWKWSGHTDSSFRYWRRGHSVWSKNSESCVALLKKESYRWGDVNCTETHPFICDCRSKLIMKVRISLQDSVLDLNDPTVQENILEQMRQELKSKNVTDVLHLKWRKQADGKVFIKEP